MMKRRHKAYRRRGRAAARRLTRTALIDLLVKDLMRREPHMKGHESDARFRVSHTSPGKADTLRFLALSARIRGLITEDQYVAIAGEKERIRA
jgi:hypothetical protein